MPETSFEKPFRRLFQLLKLDSRDIFYLLAYAFFGGIISLTLPLGVQAIINLLATGQTSTSWVVLTVIISLATVLVGLLKISQLNITETLQQRIFTRAAFEFAYRIPRFKIEHLDDNYPPELANRFFDTLVVQKGLPKLLIDFSEACLQIFFGLILLGLYHPFFLAFGVVLLLGLGVVLLLTGRSGLKTSLIESKYKYKVAYWLEELGRSLQSFKLSGINTYTLSKTDEYVQGYLDYRKKHFGIIRWQLISIIGIKTLATASLLFIGGLLVINNKINIGQFVASEIVIIIVLNSLEKIILLMETLFDVLTGIEKIGVVTDLPIENCSGQDFNNIVAPNESISIQIRNLSYFQTDKKAPILDNLSLDIRAGEKVSITGWNNSGKSTLLNILIGLYEEFEGSVCYNGVPRQAIEVGSLRAHIGDYVNEEHIFHDTLYNNIVMGRYHIKHAQILKMSEQIGISDLIQNMPLGLDTMLTSEGVGLSHSNIKKIVLLRCLIGNPKLIGCEPLLGGLTDQERASVIRALTRNQSTLLAVTHKSELAKRCDRVIVLEKGQIIFDGTFNELITKPYARDLFEDF